MTTVRYLETPVELFLELQETLDALQREIQLASFDRGAEGIDETVVEGMVVQRDAMAQVRAALYDQAVAARDSGADVADLVAVYPPDAAATVRAITSAARAADSAATAGELLAPPLRPAVQEVQQWALEQVEVQLGGGEAVPFRAGAGRHRDDVSDPVDPDEPVESES